jgi:hypothetical protein
MNINQTLINAIDPYLFDYDCSQHELDPFLTNRKPFLERQQEAIGIIDGIMTQHGKKALLSQLTELARVEHIIAQLQPWTRDHVVHALLSFVLGIYINEKFLKSLGTHVDTFQWQLAGLFHDVGYPIQIAKDILQPFAQTINNIKHNLKVHTRDIRFTIIPEELSDLQNGQNSFDLIQTYLDQWELQINAKNEFESMVSSAEICHGIISSLAVLYVVDLMYQKYNPCREYKDKFTRAGSNINWNQKYFDNDIVPACTAIYIHALPTRCFSTAKIDLERAPLAFLLKLSDSLQEWERPSNKIPSGLSSDNFDIAVADDHIVFNINDSDEVKSKIRGELSDYLKNPLVKIE